MKIHIIGATGSGKTTLARELAEKLHLPYYELDTVMWSSTVEFAGKNPPEVRERLLHQIIDQDRWIVEGVYHKWLAESFARADVIYYLDTPEPTRHLRIMKRFVKQRLGYEPSNYKQTFTGLLKMLQWNHQFDRKNRLNIFEMLMPYQYKFHVLTTAKQIMLHAAKGR